MAEAKCGTEKKKISFRMKEAQINAGNTVHNLVFQLVSLFFPFPFETTTARVGIRAGCLEASLNLVMSSEG